MINEDAYKVLKQYWGYNAFRPLQEEIIETVLLGKDVMVLFPTGGGKSLCFQVPALVMEGICIVITPLIALMKDQVEQLTRRQIKASAIHAGMGRNQIDYTLDNCIYGDVRFLYVSPERLLTPLFLERASRMNISLVAVDEAHCISQWGYDFRPAYLKISEFRKHIPAVPFMALTASATDPVKKDIADKLELRNPSVFSQSLSRSNLSYSVFEEESKERKLLKVLQRVQGTVIVYAGTRKKTQELAIWLNRNGLNADFYHAGLDFKARSKKQSDWIQDKIRIMVATNAFGMGIDKPDVRLVVHFDLPESLEAYYQEAGRAGRDGKKAYAVALFTNQDLEDMEGKVAMKYPETTFLIRVYQSLANYLSVPVHAGAMESYDMDLPAFAHHFDLPVNETFHALKLLEQEGFIQLNEEYNERSRVHIKVGNQQLYDFQIRNPQLDKFIKLLLRMYGGELFADFTGISESELARIYHVSETEIIRNLSVLQENEIADYEKRKDKPQLTYLTSRFPSEKLPLNMVSIRQKKQRDLDKVQAVIHYARTRNGCRTVELVEYFGEQNSEPCGVCDLCMASRKLKRLEEEEGLGTEILLILREGVPVSPRLLSQRLVEYNEELIMKTLQKLIADEVIGYRNDGNLYLL